MKVALLGAESTGKTALSHALADRLRLQGRRVSVVPEVLREWCARKRRLPRPEEQLPIAQEQERRVDEAAGGGAELVIADTTALMVVIYSGMLFRDGGLYRFAVEQQRGYDLTLVAGLDLPWVADGLQREGPQVRELVDTQLRGLLEREAIAYQVIYGRGEDRTRAALIAIDFIASRADATRASGQSDPRIRPWQWSCASCGDASCEHRLFTRLRQS